MLYGPCYQYTTEKSPRVQPEQTAFYRNVNKHKHYYKNCYNLQRKVKGPKLLWISFVTNGVCCKKYLFARNTSALKITAFVKDRQAALG